MNSCCRRSQGAALLALAAGRLASTAWQRASCHDCDVVSKLFPSSQVYHVHSMGSAAFLTCEFKPFGSLQDAVNVQRSNQAAVSRKEHQRDRDTCLLAPPPARPSRRCRRARARFHRRRCFTCSHASCRVSRLLRRGGVTNSSPCSIRSGWSAPCARCTVRCALRGRRAARGRAASRQRSASWDLFAVL